MIDKNKRAGIAVAGSLLVDNIYEISAYPAEGELTQIRSIKMTVGGLVPNNGIGLKKIAPSLPIFAIGKIGADAVGEFARQTIQNAGVDTTGICVSENEKTSFTDVMSIVGGQRTFFTYAGASAEFGYDDIDWENLSCKMLHLGYFLLLKKVDEGDGLKILQKAIGEGITTSIDLVSENSDRYACVLPCLPYVDNLIINELEAGKLCGLEPIEENLPAMAEKLLSLGVRERVILHTPKIGLCAEKNGKVTSRPSCPLPKGFVKGKTGAGDAFCSGALVAIERGASAEEILELAEAVAVSSLTEANATDGILSEAEALKAFRALQA